MHMEAYAVQTVVIGAGVVGLAVARELAQAGQTVMVLEQHASIGTEISARNSEVIHAGLYYPTGSLKAQLCVQGNALLYDYVARKGVPYKRLGKLVVATQTAQIPALQALFAQAQLNHVPGITWLTAAQAQALEPQLHCVAALHSASTGIIDSHAYMLALQGDLEAAGGSVVCHAQLIRGEMSAGGVVLRFDTPDGEIEIVAQTLVNCAGLYAAQVAQMFESFPSQHIPQAFYAKGSYFSLSAPTPFSRLVYPMHSAAGLGIHLTLDLGGQARFGPDVEWLHQPQLQAIDYAVSAGKAPDFYASIRQYWPALPEGALQAAYSGVRPKISGPNEQAADFVISGPAQHGVPGVVHLFGIESPGLTASLALAQAVRAQLA